MKLAGWIFLFVLSIVATNNSQASVKIGNGGNVVVCYDNHSQVVSTEVLDIFETRALNPSYQYDLGPEFLDYKQKARFAIEKLRSFSPQRAQAYLAFLSTAQVDFLIGALPDTGDFGNLRRVLPRNCSMRQLAYQSSAPFTTQKQILVSAPLWSQLSSNQQAATLVHETLLTETSAVGNATSQDLRPFVALLVSKDFAQIKFEKFVHKLYEAGFRDFEYAGLVLRFTDPAGQPSLPVFENGALRSAEAPFGSLLSLDHRTFRIEGRVSFTGERIESFYTANPVVLVTGRRLPPHTLMHVMNDGQIAELH